MTRYDITKRRLINAVTGVIYEMHPYHHPEGIDAIVDKIEEFYETSDKVKFKRFLEVSDKDEFNPIIKDILMSIPEFRKLNISRKLRDQGVDDLDDERNQGIRVTTRYDSCDDRYTDFIDLDAAIQNITYQLFAQYQYSDDCFLCNFAKEYGSMEPGDERCSTCICNPNMNYNREPHPMSIKPHNEWTEEEIEKFSIV